MRDPARILRMTILLSDLWEKYPDVRLGQLVSNLVAGVKTPLFYLEDEEMEKLIREALENGF